MYFNLSVVILVGLIISSTAHELEVSVNAPIHMKKKINE